MNFLRKVLSSGKPQELASISAGQLYLVRSAHSPRGYSECIFKDAAAIIRRTTLEHHYQLVVERVYEEGEEDLEDDDYQEDGPDDDNTQSDRGVRKFTDDDSEYLLDESLEFQKSTNQDGLTVLLWKDLSGEPNDWLQYVVDESVSPETLDTFYKTALQCEYERKYKKLPSGGLSDPQLLEFVPKSAVIASRVVDEPSGSLQSTPQKVPEPLSSAKTKSEIQNVSAPETPVRQLAKPVVTTTTPDKFLPGGDQHYSEGNILCMADCELHLFDSTSGSFILQASDLTALVTDTGNWSYWLDVKNKQKDSVVLSVEITPEMNPCFNFEHLSFIFNFYSDDTAFSWLIKFANEEEMNIFQEGLMRALWETLNKQKWLKANEQDREYVLEAFQDLELKDISEDEGDKTESGSEDEEEEETERPSAIKGSTQQDVEEDDFDEGEAHLSGQGKNSQLAVGYKNDRSYVVRGDRIGVFRHSADNDLEFSTTIENVSTPKGKTFSPKKVMLHTQDTSMVLQNKDDPSSLYRMDLEYGKVVDEWKISDNVKVQSFGPSEKFSQLTGEQTFLGISDKSLFRVDPRLSKEKIVEGEWKQYATKNDFSALSTTENGYVAVASNKGDIRLYDRVGINAKTALPALGEPIVGLDTSADGRWILATCRTYLLLIDAEIKDGKNAGALGFKKSFGKDTKPRPRRLQLSPEHVAAMQAETRNPLSLTVAHFNTGVGAKETSIVSSSGPFVITWSLRKLLRGEKVPYVLKRYSDTVMADDFRYNTDRDVIIALPDDVGMVAKRSFRKPTRESIATPVRRFLSRSDVVNSPY